LNGARSGRRESLSGQDGTLFARERDSNPWIQVAREARVHEQTELGCSSTSSERP